MVREVYQEPLDLKVSQGWTGCPAEKEAKETQDPEVIKEIGERTV